MVSGIVKPVRDSPIGVELVSNQPERVCRIAMTGVFLDRDGVVNEEVDLLHRPEQLKLIAGAPEGIRLLNDRGLPVIVVTNQSVVARGLATPRQVVEIHRRLRAMLAKYGCELRAILYCPYHEKADVALYRRATPDRKPDPGMLIKGARRFGLELDRSYMVGDQTTDVESGRRAGCKTVLVRTGYGGRDGKFPAIPDHVCENLFDAASLIVAEVQR